MPLPEVPPIVCPVLVGRTAALEGLIHLATRAAAGERRVALVTGEAGIGKSRLVAEAVRRLREAQPAVLVVRGRCFEEDRIFPYAPVVDLIRDCLATCAREGIPTAVGPAGPELSRLLPELAGSVPTPIASSGAEPEQERRRLYGALAQLLLYLASRRPVVAVLEDVHWGDDASLEFVQYLARYLASQRLLLVLTYRYEEVQSALARLLAALARDRMASETMLGPLSTPEVDAMVRAIFGQNESVRAEFLEALCTLTDGNPFSSRRPSQAWWQRATSSTPAGGGTGNRWTSCAYHARLKWPCSGGWMGLELRPGACCPWQL